MKTRCPACKTVFRITPAQLKARAGKVRCGQCQQVFNALDHLQAENPTPTAPRVAPHAVSIEELRPAAPVAPTVAAPEQPTSIIEPAVSRAPLALVIEPAVPPASSLTTPLRVHEPVSAPPVAEEEPPNAEIKPLSEHAAHALGRASGLIIPRETTDIPGYSKWTEGPVTASLSSTAEKTIRWPFTLAAVLLLLALCGQLIFYFRAEVARAVPTLQPWLVSLSRSFKKDFPLPRQIAKTGVEGVGIEVSDLQKNPARDNLLELRATLRNSAAYEQAYPSLELKLTGTQGEEIARRVFVPSDYLSVGQATRQAFAARSVTEIHLWIEAKGITDAGYLLSVFYP